MKLTDQQLKSWFPHCPKAVRTEILPILNKTCLQYKITTELRIAAFLATLAVESAEFQFQEEIASGAAYEGRKDLGNTQKGDGKLFKGRGRIQITGRTNYQLYTDYLDKTRHLPFVDFVLNPKKLAEEPYATDSACWFFAELIKANPLADKRRFLEIQLRVNGGRKRNPPRPNHWKERLAYYERGLRILPDDFVLSEESTSKPKQGFTEQETITIDNTHPDYPIVEETSEPIMATLETTETPKNMVVVETPQPKNFLEKMWAKVAGLVAGNGVFQIFRDYAEQVQALGLSPTFWLWVTGIIVTASVFFLIIELYKHRSDTQRDKDITDMLIRANSGDNVQIVLAQTEELPVFEKLGYKVITR